MAFLADVPSLNATLNALAGLLLVVGALAIRRRRLAVHGTCMLSALVTSALFLVSYLAYHARVGSVRFSGPDSVRAVYLGILITHSFLAALVAPASLIVAALAARRRWSAHRTLARWVLPVWLYVSATGVVVYWMLYRL